MYIFSTNVNQEIKRFRASFLWLGPVIIAFEVDKVLGRI
jgi:hypothetical protein